MRSDVWEILLYFGAGCLGASLYDLGKAVTNGTPNSIVISSICAFVGAVLIIVSYRKLRRKEAQLREAIRQSLVKIDERLEHLSNDL